MIVYIKDSNPSTRKLLQLINTSSKMAGYKINTQKSLLLLYDRDTEKEIMKTIILTIASKKSCNKANKGSERLS